MGKAFELELQNQFNRMRDRVRWLIQNQPGFFPGYMTVIIKGLPREVPIEGDTEADLFAAIDAAMELTNVN